MDIRDYKDNYCNGNKAEFARVFGRLPQNVTKMFNEPDKWMVVVTDWRHYLVQIRGVRKAS